MSNAAATAAYDAVMSGHESQTATSCTCGWVGKDVYRHRAGLMSKASKAYQAVMPLDVLTAYESVG